MNSPKSTHAREATVGPWVWGTVGPVVFALVVGVLDVSLWLAIVIAVPATLLIVALITLVRGRAGRETN